MAKKKDNHCLACGGRGFEPDGAKCVECNGTGKTLSSKKKK